MGKLVIAYYAIMVLFGLLIPENILSAHSGLKAFTDFMAAIVPQIDRVTELGRAPEVNRLVYSVLWLVAPVLGAAGLFWAKRQEKLSNQPKALPKMTVFMFAGVLVFTFLVTDWAMTVPVSAEFGMPKAGRGMFVSRYGMAIYAPILVLGLSLFLMGSIAMIKAALTGKITWVKGFWTEKKANHGGQ